MLQKCKIIDTTLREGEQTPGVIFSLEEKCQIIDGLAQIGIHEIELGIGAPLVTCLPELMRYSRARWPAMQTSIWSRCRPADISCTADLRPDVISLSIPISDLHLSDKMDKNRKWAAETMAASIALARKAEMRVAVGLRMPPAPIRNFSARWQKLQQTPGFSACASPILWA